MFNYNPDSTDTFWDEMIENYYADLDETDDFSWYDTAFHLGELNMLEKLHLSSPIIVDAHRNRMFKKFTKSHANEIIDLIAKVLSRHSKGENTNAEETNNKN